METVNPLPIPGANKLTTEQQAEYGRPTFRQKVVKYIGYGLLIIFALALIGWPFLIGTAK